MGGGQFLVLSSMSLAQNSRLLYRSTFNIQWHIMKWLYLVCLQVPSVFTIHCLHIDIVVGTTSVYHVEF